MLFSAVLFAIPLPAQGAEASEEFQVRPLEGAEIDIPKPMEGELPSPARPEMEPLPQIQPEFPAKPEPPAEPEPPAKPEVVPVVPVTPKAPEPAPVSINEQAEAELKFYEYSFGSASTDMLPVLQDQLDAFLQQYRDLDIADQGIYLRSQVKEKQNDLSGAAVDILKMLYEYPQTKLTFNAKRKLLEIADKRLRKHKTALTEIAKAPVAGMDAPVRFAALLRSLADIQEKELAKPLGAELREFLVRYPGHASAGEIAFLLARHHSQNGEHRAAILIDEKLLALSKDSGLRAKAQTAIGDIYATALKDYNKAVEAYQTVTEKYADSPEAGDAYLKMAGLLAESLNQSTLAVEKLEEFIKLHPEGDAAHDAWRQVIEIASSAKDFSKQAQSIETFAEKYPKDEFSADGLLDAADLYEKKLADTAGAKRVLQKVVSAYPGSKQAKSANKRLAKLGQ
ncbi:MAG: tetratricopeptide repeat protein [Elusimicrobiota bacterium]